MLVVIHVLKVTFKIVLENSPLFFFYCVSSDLKVVVIYTTIKPARLLTNA